MKTTCGASSPHSPRGGSTPKTSTALTLRAANSFFRHTLLSLCLLSLISAAARAAGPTITLAVPKPGTTTTTPNKLSAFPQPSSDGSYMAFLSQASDLVTGFVDNNESPSPNQNDLYLRDMTTGAITLVSHKNGSTTEGGNGPMGSGPRISDDGRYLIFYSSSTDLVATAVSGVQRPYLYDRVTGTTILIADISVSAVAMSGDGNWMGFYSDNNVPKNIYDGSQGTYTGPSGGFFNIYCVNRASGAVTLITHTPGSTTTTTSASAQSIITSSDGRYWAFEYSIMVSGWDPVSSGTYTGEASYVWDRQTDTFNLMTKRNDGTAPSTNVSNPTIVAMTPDGRYVFFAHNDINLGTASADNNSVSDLYRYDQQGGATKLSRYFFDVINIAPDAATSLGEFSPNGRYFAFATLATNVGGGDTNGRLDVFRLDTNDNSIVRCSGNSDGTPWAVATNGNFASTSPQAMNSGDVFFATSATAIGFTDSNAGNDIVQATFAVAGGNITVTNPSTTTGTAGTAFSQTFTQTGASGTATFTLDTGTLPAGLSLSTAGVLSGTPTQTGSFPITVKVTDSASTVGTSPTYTLVIACQTITVTNPATTTGTAGTAFSQTFTQSGAISTATFTLNSGTLPAGLTLSSVGVLSGTPTQTGSFPVTVKVTDSNGCTGTGATYTLVIGCQTITVTNPATTTGMAGAPFSQSFTQSGAISTATFTLNSGTLPAGLTLSASGVLSGTPTQPGSFPVMVKVTDSNGCTGTGATCTLVITCQAITVTNPATTTGTVGAPFSQSFTQSGAISTATFTLNSGTLPAGLTLSSAGVLSGAPTQPGSFPVTVTVTDSNGCTGTGATCTLVIACQTITVTNPATTTSIVNTAFSQTFTQSGASGGATFTTASTLPAGLTLSAAGVLSGTPTETGTFPITVTVTDGNTCTGTGPTYTLVIARPPVTISSLARVTSTPTNAASVSWTLTFSSAVAGLTSSHLGLTGDAATGSSIGTPTTADSGLTYSIPVTTGSTDGALILRVVNDTGLAFAITNTLPFDGDTITVDKTPPTVQSVTRLTPLTQTTGATSVTFHVTYSEPVTLTAPEADRFVVMPINGSTVVASVTGVSGTGATRDVTVTITGGSGEFRLRVQD